MLQDVFWKKFGEYYNTHSMSHSIKLYGQHEGSWMAYNCIGDFAVSDVHYNFLYHISSGKCGVRMYAKDENLVEIIADKYCEDKEYYGKNVTWKDYEPEKIKEKTAESDREKKANYTITCLKLFSTDDLEEGFAWMLSTADKFIDAIN